MHVSTARDNIKIMISSFRDLTSNAILKAEMKPAIGALILSFWEPSLLSAQRMNLYPQLNMQTKRPNFAESIWGDKLILNSLAYMIAYNSLISSLGLAMRAIILNNIMIPNPKANFLITCLIQFSKQPNWCLQLADFSKKAGCRILLRTLKKLIYSSRAISCPYLFFSSKIASSASYCFSASTAL